MNGAMSAVLALFLYFSIWGFFQCIFSRLLRVSSPLCPLFLLLDSSHTGRSIAVLLGCGFQLGFRAVTIHLLYFEFGLHNHPRTLRKARIAIVLIDTYGGSLSHVLVIHRYPSAVLPCLVSTPMVFFNMSRLDVLV